MSDIQTCTDADAILAEAYDPIVGHKTFDDGNGGFRHEPLHAREARELLDATKAAEHQRVELMPDERSAIRMLFNAWQRLKELGWGEAIYCPKDGREFEVIEVGSTGIHRCRYDGVWPNGHWWIIGNGDLWPSRPILYRKLPDKQQELPRP